MRTEYVENDNIKAWLEEGIIHAQYKPHLKKINLEIAKELVATRLKIADHITRPLLMDLGNLISADSSSRKFLSEGEANKYLSATAIIVKDQITKFVAGIFIRFNEPKIPTKFFTKKEEALEWLQQYKPGGFNAPHASN